jgi:Cd2+/Zn2+-exporting ATPase
MDCADCALHLEEAAGRLKGVAQVKVSFATGKMHLTPEQGADVLPQVQALVRQMGYEALPVARLAGAQRERRPLLRRKDWPVAAAAALLLVALALRLATGAGVVVNGLLTAATLLAGWPIARSGWATLRAARRLDMNTLMSIAALGALAIGEYDEAAVVILLFSVGELLESYTMDRARGAIHALMDASPQEAIRLTPDGDERVPVEALAVGDRVLVRPGVRLPADGEVVEGRSAVNQAPITGESMPVDKGPGSAVYAGTINGPGALTVRVTRPAADSTIARVVRPVEEAQEQRAPTQRFVDRFARIYTPLVIGGAALVAVVPPLVGLGAPLDWLYRALVLLVIACPCALVISTPVAVVSGLAAAARAGVLVKGGVHLEQLARLRALAFDKTGTLTRGRPQLVRVRCADHDPDLAPSECRDCHNCQDLMAKAAAVEHSSEHPLAQAVVEWAERSGLAGRYEPAQEVEAVAGQGVRGRVGGHTITVGSHAYIHGDQHTGPSCDDVETAAANGQTAIVVEDTCCGTWAYGLAEDTLREEAPAVIAALKRTGIAHTIMLTGDNPATAAAIARSAGVDEVRASLLPEQKVDAIGELLEEYGAVGMVGDGVNDAPALARASVGIAMGAAGSDAALETADVALMGDDLNGLPFAVRLSRQVEAIIRQNVALSLATKGVFLILALAGVATLWMAVFADMGVSLLVTFNGMRPLARRK